MSMLAGPRRKQKVINLRAKNSTWSNDSNKFGQKMLEKMGWSAGKGLGAKENGIAEHVVARYKNDEKGLGYEDKNDQWTKHEDDFNSLLANLSNDSVNTDKLHSGVSLEVKSKKSKARVHYHKFTRGKDISRYSEKDLANIFGKKSLLKDNEPVKEIINEEVKITEQVFRDGGNMDDYFKNKMKAFKSLNNEIADTDGKDDSNDVNYAFQGFGSDTDCNDKAEETPQGFGFQPFSFYNINKETTMNNSCDNAMDINVSEGDKVSKNHSKWQSVEKGTFTECNAESVDNVLELKKKKKKSKKTREENSNDIQAHELPYDSKKDTSIEENTKPKSKRKKQKSQEEVQFSINEHSNVENCINIDKNLTKKKKKNVDKEINLQEVEVDENLVIESNVSYKKKKSKKRKNSLNVDEDKNEITVTEEVFVPKKKKKRKNCDN